MTLSTQNQSMQLSQLLKGDQAFLVDIDSDRGLISRLSALGFTPGVQLTMIQNYGRGPLVVSVRGVRVALGRKEAGKALVTKGSLR